jgi:hypothetical protein
MKLFNIFKSKKKNTKYAQPGDTVNVHTPVKYADPYVILIENTTNEEREWVIFGSNKFLCEENFGSDEGVEVKNLGNVEMPYSSILEEFSKTKIKCGIIRVQSENRKDVSQSISHHTIRNTNGIYAPNYERRDIFLAIMMDAYQQQADIIDFRPTDLFIDGQTHFSGKIQPNSRIAFSVFPIEKIIGSNENLDIERLNGKNVAPVIIQTGFHDSNSKKKKSFWSRLKSIFKKKETKETKDEIVNKF